MGDAVGPVNESRHAVEQLAEDFASRLRNGETPSLDEYAAAYPDMKEEIEALFPTIAALEGLRRKKERPADGRASLGAAKLRQLGDFRILREIGRGGMGVVYEAEQESLRRRVAVKVLPKQSLLEEKHLRRFQREARTAASLHHTNIVPILAVGVHDDYHYYAMQLIDGIGLDQMIEGLAAKSSPQMSVSRLSELWRQFQEDQETLAPADSSAPWQPGSSAASRQIKPNSDSLAGPAPAVLSETFAETRAQADAATQTESENASPDNSGSGIAAIRGPDSRRKYWQIIADIGIQSASALHHAHQHGVLHRDVKPGNLILDDSGTVWMADFGLAKAAEHDQVSRTGDIVGTLRFMAPEQLRGEADARSDIYALGVTLYELLTLQPAHQESTRKQALISGTGGATVVPPRKINPNIPRDLETIILRALAEEPKDRYQDAEQLAEDLERFMDDRPILARRAGAFERTWRWARRNPAVASLSTIAATLLAMVAVIATIGYARTHNALAQESEQRERAESALGVSLEALDRVYQRFAPDRVLVAPKVSIGDAENEENLVELPSQPELSKDTAALLKDLLTSYDKLAALDSDDLRLQSEVAKANRRLGDIYQRLDERGEATAAYDRAISLYAKLIESNRSSDQCQSWQTEISRIQNELGGIFTRSGDLHRAMDAHEQSLNTLQTLAAESGATTVRFELARTHYLLSGATFGAPIMRFGRPPGGSRGSRMGSSGSGESAEDGRSHRPPPQPGPPGQGPGAEPDPRRPRKPPFGGPRGHGKRGGPPGPDMLGPQKREQIIRSILFRPLRLEQREHLDQAVELLVQLEEENPGVPEYSRMLALCYREQFRGGEDEQALSKAAVELQQLVDDYPKADDYRYDLAMTLAAESFNTSDIRPLEQAIEHTRKLDGQTPAFSNARAELCAALATAILRKNEQLPEDAQSQRLEGVQAARQLLIETVSVHELLLQSNPDSSPYLGRIANSLEMLGGVTRQLETPEGYRDAEAAFAKAAKHLEALLAQSSQHPLFARLHWPIAKLHQDRAECFELLGDTNGANKARTMAQDHLEALKSLPMPGFGGRGRRPGGKRPS